MMAVFQMLWSTQNGISCFCDAPAVLHPNFVFPDPLPLMLLQDFAWEAEGGFGKGGT